MMQKCSGVGSELKDIIIIIIIWLLALLLEERYTDLHDFATMEKPKHTKTQLYIFKNDSRITE